MARGALILLNQPRCLPVPGFLLDEGTLICGRSSECHLVLPHETVSRRHTELRVAGFQVEVVDLESRNGTFVNGKRVQCATIRLGDTLAMGEVTFVLLDAADAHDDGESRCETVSTREARPSLLSALSAAQRRVLDLLLDGLAEKQIATRLDISRHTAHNHVRNIYRALDVHSRAELLAKLVVKDGADGVTGIRLVLPGRAGPSTEN